jgi:nitrogen fixation NifU-like protein
MDAAEVRAMYQEHILDNYKNPQNHGTLDNPTDERRGYNPLCGDDLTDKMIIKNTKIEDIKFKGNGCAISIASTSLLSEFVKGKTVAEVKKLTKEDILELLEIPISHARIKCALLCLETIHKILFKKEGVATTEGDK